MGAKRHKRGKHRSALPDLNRSIKWLESFPQVIKVVLGLSESCRHKYTPGFLRYQRNVTGGIRVIGYSGSGVTELFVRLDNEDVPKIIEEIGKRYASN